MRNKHLPNYLNLGLTFSGALLMMLQAVLPATAQTGNQSDATGPIYSGSDIAGNLTEPLTGSQIVVEGVDTTKINVNLLNILTCSPNLDASNEAVSNALSNAPGTPPFEKIQKLLKNLQCLLKDSKEKNINVDATQLLATIRAYNDMILASNEEFLRQPPAELLAIQAVLSQLIAAAGAS